MTVNGTKCQLVPSSLRDEIKRKWLSLGGDDSNPIERISFSIQQLGDQLMIVPHSMGGGGGEGGAVPVAGFIGNVVTGGGESSDAMFSQMFLMQQQVEDLRNEISASFVDCRRHIK